MKKNETLFDREWKIEKDKSLLPKMWERRFHGRPWRLLGLRKVWDQNQQKILRKREKTMTANNSCDGKTCFDNSQTAVDLSRRPDKESIGELKLCMLRKTLVEHDHPLAEEVYFLPFQIKTLKLNNVGPLDGFEAHFHRNSVNVIYGPNASGKSTIIRSILLAFGIKHPYFSNKVLKNGTITLELFPSQTSVTITGMENRENIGGYQCLLSDDPFVTLEPKAVRLLVSELNRINIQFVVTANTFLNADTFPKDTYIVSLNNK